MPELPFSGKSSLLTGSEVSGSEKEAGRGEQAVRYAVHDVAFTGGRGKVGVFKNEIDYQHSNKITEMIIMPIKEGENIERALKKFKRKYERTGVLKELRRRQYFTKPSVVAREAKLHAIYVQHMDRDEE